MNEEEYEDYLNMIDWLTGPTDRALDALYERGEYEPEELGYEGEEA